MGLLTSCNAPLMYKPCSSYFTRYTHPLTFLQPQTSSIFPFSYTVAIWNHLPYSVVTLPSISTLKSIVNYNLSITCMGIHYTNSHRYFMYPLCVSCTKFHRKKTTLLPQYMSQVYKQVDWSGSQTTSSDLKSRLSTRLQVCNVHDKGQ